MGKKRLGLDGAAVQGLLPTPMASRNANRTNARTPSQVDGRFHGKYLAVEVRELTRVGLLPTPSTKGDYNRKGASARSGDGLATVVGGSRGRLSPEFVEWMMGLPPGWTDLRR